MDDVSNYGDERAWLNYNRVWRPGCALFVDGKCVERGTILNNTLIEDAERRLAVHGVGKDK
jgi:hypothetical protein